MAQDSDRWLAVEKVIKDLGVPRNSGSLSTVSFQQRLLRRVSGLAS